MLFGTEMVRRHNLLQISRTCSQPEPSRFAKLPTIHDRPGFRRWAAFPVEVGIAAPFASRFRSQATSSCIDDMSLAERKGYTNDGEFASLPVRSSDPFRKVYREVLRGFIQTGWE
jgi:hypothetical protein